MRKRSKELAYLAKNKKGKKRKNNATGNYRGRAGASEVLKAVLLILLLLVILALGVLLATQDRWAASVTEDLLWSWGSKF